MGLNHRAVDFWGILDLEIGMNHPLIVVIVSIKSESACGCFDLIRKTLRTFAFVTNKIRFRQIAK